MKKSTEANHFEREYIRAQHEMDKGNLVYCNTCHSVLPNTKRLFIKHLKKHNKYVIN